MTSSTEQVQVAGTHGTIVAGYLRKSSTSKSKQVTSIPDQRKAILEYCEARGWQVVWYDEGGKSGSKDEHLRKEWERLLTDARKPDRPWSGVLVWHSDRLNRNDSLDQEGINKLRKAGVFIETICEGRIDLNSTVGRMTFLMRAEGNYEYVEKLSRNTMRGRREALEDGYWTSGFVPFAYDRCYVKEGYEPVVLSRTMRAGRPSGYKLKPVLNKSEVVILRWIFSEFLGGKSRRSIASELNKKGIATPQRDTVGWTAQTVTQVLQNPAYTGDIVPGFNPRSKKPKFNSLNGMSKKGVLPVLIDADSFAAVQRRIALEKTEGRKHSTPRHESGLLSSLVTCGHCGWGLKKGQRKQKVCKSCGVDVARTPPSGRCTTCKGAVGNEHRVKVYYYCPSSMYVPGPSACRCHCVMENEIIPLVRDNLLKRIEAEVLSKVLNKSADKPNPNLDKLKAKAAELRADVKTAGVNLARAKAEAFESIQANLIEWQKELEAIDAEVALAERLTGKEERKQVAVWLEDLRGEWQDLNGGGRRSSHKIDADELAAIKDEMIGVPHESELDEPMTVNRQALRGLLERLNVKIACHWKPSPNGHGEVPDLARIASRFEIPLSLSTDCTVWTVKPNATNNAVPVEFVQTVSFPAVKPRRR